MAWTPVSKRLAKFFDPTMHSADECPSNPAHDSLRWAQLCAITGVPHQIERAVRAIEKLAERG